MAGAEVVGGLDAWEGAANTFKLNFPNAEVWPKKAENVSPKVVLNKCGDINLLLASPECTSHSVAKGNARRCESSRATAFQVVRYAEVLKPRWIVVENVPRMQLWRRYNEWIKAIRALGYQTWPVVLDSQDYGTPQSRKRLFILCDREQLPSTPPKVPGRKRSVRSILMRGEIRNQPWQFRKLDPSFHAEATLERAERGIESLGRQSEFIMVYYGSDGAGGFQKIDRPLRTVTTLDRFAFVRPKGRGHEMRMLQPPELAAAMGFPRLHQWPKACRRVRIRLIGNAVCPPVMCAVVRHLTANPSPCPDPKGRY